jgi:hypothetical protein
MTDEDAFKRNSDKFHMFIGYCIAEWANIERQLFRICWTASRCPKHQASIIYFRTPTIDARLSLVKELVESVLPKPERKSGGHPHETVVRWRDVESAIRDELSVRRRVAHFPTTFRYDTEAGELIRAGESTDLYEYTVFELYMSPDEQLRERGIEKLTVAQHDLDAHFRNLSQAARQLDSFFHVVLKKRVGEPLETQPQ